jgi:hypothetical protein
MNLRNITFVSAIVLMEILAGCKKLVDVKAPPTSLSSDNVYASDPTAASVLTGIYAKMSSGSFGTISSLPAMSLSVALTADELRIYSGVINLTQLSYYRNSLSSNSQNGGGFEVWSVGYPIIFTCNAAIEGMTASNGITPSVKQQLLGEAKFMRAFVYFYLTSLYGDVPLVLTSDYKANSVLKRAPQSQVYQQIIADLKDAQSELSESYLMADAMTTYPTSGIQRLRPTKWAATALLARTYLYINDWPNAEVQATILINKTSLYQLEALGNVFLSVSKEAIWQLQPVNTGWNTEDGRIFILPSTGPSTLYPVYLSDWLMKAFEPGDTRYTNWISSIKVGTTLYYFANKYKSAKLNSPITEYEAVFRLGEQYLIRAEARAEQNNLSGSLQDINAIRARAGLPNSLVADINSLRTVIFHERQVELFMEWAHRWLDMKRTQRTDSIMSIVTPQKGGIWNPNWKLFPLPLADLLVNPNLIQNPGY